MGPGWLTHAGVKGEAVKRGLIMDITGDAAWNNAVWCDTVCRAHGARCAFTDSAWICYQGSPPFYPNIVTLQGAPGSTEVKAHILDLIAQRMPGRWTVKDSYSALDLSELPFKVLFDASWIVLPIASPLRKTGKNRLTWQTITDGKSLHSWEECWLEAAQVGLEDSPARFFPGSLLQRFDISFIAGYNNRQPMAGAILNRTDDVTGLSNVFICGQDRSLCWAEIVDHARQLFPGTPIVGYETGGELRIAEELGFQRLPDLRIWQFQGNDDSEKGARE